MNTSSDPPERTLDSALLLLSREARVLADLLSFALPAEQIAAWAKAAGRRKPGRPQPALQLAEALSLHHKIRSQVALALHEILPEAADSEDPGVEDEATEVERSWLYLVGLLRSAELADWESALALICDSDWTWPAATVLGTAPGQVAPADRTIQPQASETKPAAPTRASPAETEAKRLARIQTQLKAARQEAAALQEELGNERRRRHAEEVERSQVLAEAEAERLRATELKQQLARRSSSSEREDLLDGELRELRHSVHVLAQKVAWLEDERDDLRGVLADHDRFDSIEEEVPSFRDRPLTQPEQELTHRLEARNKSGAPSFRVLVVGGGQPQHRHQDKLVEYAESLGFQAHWRMAEYQAWHRAMDGLRRDMQERYDALVILHWNRTTFTRKAREICDSGGAKPCLTCHYEGFTNLRESLQECLRELLAAAERSQAK